MYADERTAFDNSGWRYDTALSLVKAGKNEDAVDLVLIFVTDRGQAWRMKQDLRFINA